MACLASKQEGRQEGPSSRDERISQKRKSVVDEENGIELPVSTDCNVGECAIAAGRSHVHTKLGFNLLLQMLEKRVRILCRGGSSDSSTEEKCLNPRETHFGSKCHNCTYWRRRKDVIDCDTRH